MKTVEVRISGRVQGVGFRYFTRSLARRYGVTGLVENESDGSVHLVAQAEERMLKMFLKHLKVQGPPHASIEEFVVKVVSKYQEYPDFRVIT